MLERAVATILSLCIFALTSSGAIGASSGGVVGRAPPTMTLDPSLEGSDEYKVSVGCLCLSDGQLKMVVPAGDQLTDTAIKINTPFLVQPTLGTTCQQICLLKYGDMYRCLSGVTRIQHYNPSFVSTNANAPGYIYITAQASETSKRDCQ